jgi:AraC-like DNA-binding protein
MTNRINMDKLDSLLTHSLPTTQVFYVGQLSKVTRMGGDTQLGGMHVLRDGQLSVRLSKGFPIKITEPSLILVPRSITYDLVPKDMGGKGVEVICARADFGLAMSATLMRSIPDVLVIPLMQSSHLLPMLGLLFQEAENKNCGKQAALNHLMNYFLVLVLRQLMEGKEIKDGVIAALADKRLAFAITGMHDQPHLDWTLESLAQTAGMSRASFANRFRITTGTTALAYLTSWRMEIVKTLLKKGNNLKAIAPKVGYGSTEALIRTFLRYSKQTPKEWLKSQSI